MIKDRVLEYYNSCNNKAIYLVVNRGGQDDTSTDTYYKTQFKTREKAKNHLINENPLFEEIKDSLISYNYWFNYQIGCKIVVMYNAIVKSQEVIDRLEFNTCLVKIDKLENEIKHLMSKMSEYAYKIVTMANSDMIEEAIRMKAYIQSDVKDFIRMFKNWYSIDLQKSPLGEDFINFRLHIENAFDKDLLALQTKESFSKPLHIPEPEVSQDFDDRNYYPFTSTTGRDIFEEYEETYIKGDKLFPEYSFIIQQLKLDDYMMDVKHKELFKWLIGRESTPKALKNILNCKRGFTYYDGVANFIRLEQYKAITNSFH